MSKYINLLLESVADDHFNRDDLIMSLLIWFGEDQIKEFCLESESRETAWHLVRRMDKSSIKNYPELQSEYDYIRGDNDPSTN